MTREAGKRGRPRVWSSSAQKHQEWRARKAEKTALLEELLHAVRNAAIEDPQLQRVVNEGDDAAVLRALTAHYQARHWNLLCWQTSQEKESKQT